MGTFKNRAVAAFIATFSTIGGIGPAEAGPLTPIDAFDIMYQPRSRAYVPDTSDNLDDTDKSFVVECTVGENGHMAECHAEDNDIDDEGIVDAAVTDIGRWVVGKRLRNGESSAGRSFEVTCRFQERREA